MNIFKAILPFILFQGCLVFAAPMAPVPVDANGFFGGIADGVGVFGADHKRTHFFKFTDIKNANKTALQLCRLLGYASSHGNVEGFFKETADLGAKVITISPTGDWNVEDPIGEQAHPSDGWKYGHIIWRIVCRD